MNFEEYQKQYVTFMKSMTKTRMAGILTKEIFTSYPENLPKKYQKQMYKETLFLKNKQHKKPEKFSAYTRHTMQLLYLEMLNINFIHKLAKGDYQEFLDSNPPITEVYNESYLTDSVPDTDISYNEFMDFLNSDTKEAQFAKSKTAKKERMQKAWLFDHWFYYQEIITVMSLLESFLRDSYDIYVQALPEAKDLSHISKNSADLCFTKLLKYFMQDELKLIQRFGEKNQQFLQNFWSCRNAITHNGGVFNKKSLRSNKKSPYKIGEQVIVDSTELDKLYSIIGNLQRIIYKKIRLFTEKKKK